MTPPLDLRAIEMRWLEDGSNSDIAVLLASLRSTRRALCTLRQLMPNSMNGEDWGWAWNELYDKSQELVVAGEQHADAILSAVVDA